MNYYEKVANMFGVELNKKFMVQDEENGIVFKCMFTKFGLIVFEDERHWEFDHWCKILKCLLCGKMKVLKMS